MLDGSPSGVAVTDLLRQRHVAETVSAALGRAPRSDPVLEGTGGPAGNAVLTAWTGLVLLVLGVAELLTLIDMHGLISWHIAIGALLVPPALVKTASTSWRVVRYYRGNPAYAEAGPPPLVLRLLGPLVVGSTLALLATGVVLIVLGQDGSRSGLVTLLGFRLDWITLHQASFAVWATVTGLHVLARIVPALRLTFLAGRSRRLPGLPARLVVLIIAGLAAAALAVVLVRADGSWHEDRFDGAPPSQGTVRG
jgi:hypothetical protein